MTNPDKENKDSSVTGQVIEGVLEAGASGLLDEAVEVVKDAVEAGGDLAGQVVQATGEIAETAAKVAGDVAEGAVDAAGEVLSGIDIGL